MAHNSLHTVLAALVGNLDETERLAANTDKWMLITPPKGIPRFSSRHREVVIELAFFRAFLAWEVFLEESFVLYLLGKTPPAGKTPVRYVVPPNRAMAERLLVPEDRSYARWNIAIKVADRAERCFRDGRPFSPALKSRTSMFNEMRVLRNAIAHWQSSTQEKFKEMVRNRPGRGAYPPNLTVGGFLATRIPGSSPPETFLEDYLNRIRVAANEIVPT